MKVNGSAKSANGIAENESENENENENGSASAKSANGIAESESESENENETSRKSRMRRVMWCGGWGYGGLRGSSWSERTSLVMRSAIWLSCVAVKMASWTRWIGSVWKSNVREDGVEAGWKRGLLARAVSVGTPDVVGGCARIS